MKQDAVNVAQLEEFDEIVDVRSPSEYKLDRIPGAINCPVLFDDERVRVGTIHAHESSFAAKKVGAALVARNIARHLEDAFADKPRRWRPLIYCWRGGQRSASMTSVLRQTGWDARRLEGGYKAFRREVLQQIEIEENRFGFEPEITAKVAKLGCRIYEVGISYSGRTYADGKKIGWRDGVRAIVCILKYNLFR